MDALIPCMFNYCRYYLYYIISSLATINIVQILECLKYVCPFQHNVIYSIRDR